MESKEIPPSREQQDEYLQKAKEAASSGDLLGEVEAIYHSFALDGLTWRIKRNLPALNNNADFIVGQAVNALYEASR